MRYAIRTLRRSPGFTVIALLTLALGIGANTAIFSFVNGVLLKPLPYHDPHSIVMVWEKPPGGGRNGISTLNYLDWKNQNTVFTHMAAATFGGSVTLTGSGEPVELQGSRVSAAYFDIFGVQAVLGRTFAPDEDQSGKSQVVVLSHRLWENRFGADPAIVGRTLTLNGKPCTVIGVLPAHGPFDRSWAQLWTPLEFRAAAIMTRDYHWLMSFAPPQARSHARKGARGHGCHRRPHRRGVSRFQQRLGRHDRPFRGPGCRTATAPLALGVAGRGRRDSSDRLRQPGESHAGARRSPGTRDRRAGIARRRRLAPGSPVAYGEPAGGSRRRRLGARAGLRHDARIGGSGAAFLTAQ